MNLAFSALLCASFAACSTARSQRSGAVRDSTAQVSADAASSRPSAPHRIAAGRMLARSGSDAGVFLPVADDVATRVPTREPDASELRIEEDAQGGQMVRLRGRFSGILRAELSGRQLRTDCGSGGSSGAGSQP